MRQKTVRSLAILLIASACAEPVSPKGGDISQMPPKLPAPPATAPPQAPPQPSRAAYIWVIDVYDGDTRALVQGERPAYSPDGKRVLFERDGFVRILHTVFGGEVVVGSGMQPSWSPDGKRVAMVRPEGIVIVQDDGKNMSVVVPHDFRKDTYAPWDMGVGKPSWSPDGTMIAFEHLGDGDMTPAQIFLVNVDGTGMRRLTPTTGRQCAESDPAWAPDSKRVAYWSFCTGISVGTPDGEQLSLYKDFPRIAYGARPAWSPVGNGLLFVGEFGSQGPAVWRIGAEGVGVGVFITHAWDPTWSPDGVHIAFVSRTLIP